MKIDLRGEQIQRVLEISRAVNQYYQDTWQDYQDNLKRTLDAYRRNQANYQRIVELIHGNDERVDLILTDKLIPKRLYEDDKATQAIDADEYEGIHNRYHEKIWNAYTDTMFETIREYLLKTCHLPIYEMEDQDIDLRGYIDFHELVQDHRKILDDIDRWWDDNARGRSISEYTQSLERTANQQRTRANEHKRVAILKDIAQNYYFDMPTSKTVRCYNQEYGQVPDYWDDEMRTDQGYHAKYEVLGEQYGQEIVDTILTKLTQDNTFDITGIKNVHVYLRGYINFSFRNEKLAQAFYDIMTKDDSVRPA